MIEGLKVTVKAAELRELSKEDMDYCCDAFKEEATNSREMRPLAQFEPDEDGETWNVNGCCGGGCYVVRAMRFCPFCGTKLAPHGVYVEQA